MFGKSDSLQFYHFTSKHHAMSNNPAHKQSVPYAFSNHSEYADEDIYLAVVGITDGHVWMDCKTGELQPMRVTDNAIPGPVVNGNKGPGNNGLYARTRLVDVATHYLRSWDGRRIHQIFTGASSNKHHSVATVSPTQRL
jgi:hypothetical protein